MLLSTGGAWNTNIVTYPASDTSKTGCPGTTPITCKYMEVDNS